MAFGIFPATGTAGAIPLLNAGANTAVATPAMASAAASNQATLGFVGYSTALNVARELNALSALVHMTLGLGLPLGLLPANLHLFNVFRALSDLDALSGIAAQVSLSGIISRTALLQRLAATNLLLSPVSTILS